MRLARYAYKEKLLWRAALAMLGNGIERLKDITDWEQYGGAPLLGFDNVFIKAHGRSKARALGNAIRVANKAAAGGLCKNIAQGLSEFESRADDA
jgi:glycerol-3-phosphate acyltransferase PlsX